MDKSVDSADMSLEDIGMSSKELLDKREIDCGGFGKVFLCCHKKHGLVVLKTVFTGCKHDSYKNDLLQEGKIMCKLNHKRVVKLLGVILEDGNYSLVIEYMTKGNLLRVLNTIEVPVSVKARFIIEIIEGMIYLHSQKVIHKDLKPENILADDDFHVKVADLGVAAFQKWSTLTKEETKLQNKLSLSKKTSSSKASIGGTLSYMAPEHFKDINKKATEKSDVYSFGIVIWVIISNKEPYENVFSNDQLSLGVKSGQRPCLCEDMKTNLEEAAELMQECWKDEPDERPSFEECEKQFRPVYSEKYENNIDHDIKKLQKDYPEPEAFIQRMASLQVDCDAEGASLPAARDTPRSLHSLAQGHVNENMFRASNEPEECEEEKFNDNLQRKLQEEMYYHQTGSHIDNVANPSDPDTLSDRRSRKVFNEPSNMPPQAPGNCMPFNTPHSTEQAAQLAPGDNYEHAFYSSELYGIAPNNVEYALPHEHQRMPIPHLLDKSSIKPEPVEIHYEPPWPGVHGSVPHDSIKYPVAESGLPSLNPYGNYPYSRGAGHMGGTQGNPVFPKGNFSYPNTYTPSSLPLSEKYVNLTISNSRAIQIGNDNYMGFVDSPGRNRPIAQNLNHNHYKHVFESNALVNEHQLCLLRENLSKKWKEFARKVGFRQPEIEEIDHDYERDGLKEKVFQMLYKWQMKEGSKNATVGKVATALYDLEEKDLLNELIQLNKPHKQ